MTTGDFDPPGGPEVLAYADFIGHTGADEFQIRYDDEQDPIVWVAVARHDHHYSTGSGMSPAEACFRLGEQLTDGGRCTHCGRPSALTERFGGGLVPGICWYGYNPDSQKVERGCLHLVGAN